MEIIASVLNILPQLLMYEDSISYYSRLIVPIIVLIFAATVIPTIIVNYCLIVHKWKVEVITERTKEFLRDSRDYFMPLSKAAGQLSLEADSHTPRVDELCFYNLCQYVNKVNRTAQVGLYCRKLTDEAEIAGNLKLLNTVIKEVLYKNEHDRGANLLKYFHDHSEYLSFKSDLSKLNEYKIFKGNFNDLIANDLSEYSGNLCTSLDKAITEGYKPWHRYQCLRGNRCKRIDKRYEKRVRDLREKWK